MVCSLILVSPPTCGVTLPSPTETDSSFMAVNVRITMMRKRFSSQSRRQITLIIMIVSVLLSLSGCVLCLAGVVSWCYGVAKECWVLLSSRHYHPPLRLVMVVLATQTRYKRHASHSPSSTLALVRILATIVPHPYEPTNQPLPRIPPFTPTRIHHVSPPFSVPDPAFDGVVTRPWPANASLPLL